MLRLAVPLSYTPAEPRLASAVIPWRPGPEVFWVLRGKALRFSGGFWAFPGGRVDEQDGEVPVRGGAPEERALLASAARELFEETGLLCAAGGALPPPEERARWRAALLQGRASFAALLAERRLAIDGSRFLPAGRWITPPMMPLRYDAHFFLARCPEGQAPEVWPGELSSGEWIQPTAALALWERGERLLHPPACHVLRTLAAGGAPESWLARLAAPEHAPGFVARRIEFQGGVLFVPLRTPTLPPALFTNTLVLGEEELVVVDPGSPWPEELAPLIELLRVLEAEGRRVKEIWLTHQHGDHVGGAAALSRALGGVPIAAHRRTAELLAAPASGDGADPAPGAPRVAVDRFIEDGEVRRLPGRLGLAFRAVHTPGHAPGHLCFFEEQSRALLAGDMVAGTGTIIVDPPLGDMAAYVSSLQKLAALGPRAIYPAHGPVIADGPAKLAEYLAHREEREARVLAALAALDSPRTAEELVPLCYQDVAPAVYPLAARSLTAVLEKLAREGRAARDAHDRWRPA